MSECCKSGFQWTGTPVGRESTLANNKTYVTGDSKDVAIMIIHDIFGWTLPNLRLLADRFAKEAHATCYLPDFFDGEVISPESMEDPEKRAEVDLMALMRRNSKEIRGPEIFSCVEALKSKHGYKKIGVIGYCYGGWAVFQLGAKGKNLVDCISTAHPSLLTKEEIDAVGVPVQILLPEVDPMFPTELKDHANAKIHALGLPYDYQYFPGSSHGFAVRGDPNDPQQVQAFERAKRAAVSWFIEHLH